MSDNIGITALGVYFPDRIITNDYFRKKSPDLFKEFEKKQLAKIFSPVKENSPEDIYEVAMENYINDPFRGTKERRYLKENETSFDLEYRAIMNVVDAAQINIDEIELLLSCTVIPEQFPGNAAHLARKLDLKGTAWNLESACSVGTVALQTATSFIKTGEYKNALIVISCNYSKYCDEKDTLGLFMGDGAGALYVTKTKDNSGILGFKSIHTACTCDSFYTEMEIDNNQPVVRIKAMRGTNKILRDSSIGALMSSVEGACKNANVTLNDIDFFVFNTPTAWYAEFCAKTLEIPRSKTLSTYSTFANIGPTLMPANLYYAAHLNKIKKDDLVLVYSIGSVSTAGAYIMRWGDVALGKEPDNVNVKNIN